MARAQVDLAHPARHGVPEAYEIRADPAQQPGADAAGPLPPTPADAAGRARGTGGGERQGRLSPDIPRRGRGVHLARLSSVRDSASPPTAAGRPGATGILATGPAPGWPRTRFARSRRRPEFVSVMDDAGFAFLAEFPERGLDLHPDLHVFRADVDQLRGEADPLLHLDDRHDIRLLHLELRRRIMDDRVGHDRPFACETHPL